MYIDNEILSSDVYGAEVMDSPGIASEPVVLGEDEYFVLGDNRNHSSDMGSHLSVRQAWSDQA